MLQLIILLQLDPKAAISVPYSDHGLDCVLYGEPLPWLCIVDLFGGAHLFFLCLALTCPACPLILN